VSVKPGESALTSDGRARSAPMATAVPPREAISATTSSARSRFVAYPTATEALRAANPSAIARPIPREAPVTIAFFRSRSFDMRCMHPRSRRTVERSTANPHAEAEVRLTPGIPGQG
jgi:hypothetical protein